MSNEHTRDRGNLFENAEKKKPSQPDFQGNCSLDGAAYDILGWRREDQLTITLAPPRGDKNTYPPPVFKGALDVAPRKRGKQADAGPVPAWIGHIESDEAAYKITAFEKQGKSGLYFTLGFEKTEKVQEPRSVDYEPADDAEE